MWGEWKSCSDAGPLLRLALQRALCLIFLLLRLSLLMRFFLHLARMPPATSRRRTTVSFSLMTPEREPKERFSPSFTILWRTDRKFLVRFTFVCIFCFEERYVIYLMEWIQRPQWPLLVRIGLRFGRCWPRRCGLLIWQRSALLQVTSLVARRKAGLSEQTAGREEALVVLRQEPFYFWSKWGLVGQYRVQDHLKKAQESFFSAIRKKIFWRHNGGGGVPVVSRTKSESKT